MKTVIWGPVTPEHLADADLMAGITPTKFLSNGEFPSPNVGIPTEVDPPCPKLPGELGEHQRDYTLCLAADAVICVGDNEHLLKVANTYELPIYHID